MSDNAELWSRPDEKSQRITVTSWLRDHHINFDPDEPLEDLIQLYRDVECGRYRK